MEEWKKFKENAIYEARFVESVSSRLCSEVHILTTIEEFEVLEAFIKVLAMQVYEEEGSNIRFELKRHQAEPQISGIQNEVTKKTGEMISTSSQSPLTKIYSKSLPKFSFTPPLPQTSFPPPLPQNPLIPSLPDPG